MQSIEAMQLKAIQGEKWCIISTIGASRIGLLATMKKTGGYLLLAIILCCSLQSMAQQVTAQQATMHQQTDSTNLNGTWILVPVLPSDTVTGKMPFIHFTVGDNRFTGFTGCNQMSGNCIMRGNNLSFSRQIITTKMLCEGYNEKEFIANLLRVTSFKIKDGVLTLMADQTPLSKWTRKEAKPTNTL